MNFKSYQDYATLLFISTGPLPVTVIYVKESFNIIFGILFLVFREALHKLLTKASKYHNYETKIAANDNLYINFSRLKLQWRSFSRVSALI